MAAIMYSQLREMRLRHLLPYSPYWTLWPTACYTFGMPRYGNRYAVTQLEHPFHVYNEKDFVPTMPPRFLGFHDCPDEYCLTGEGRLLRPYNKGSTGFQHRNGRFRLLGASKHKIERYLERTASAYRNGVI